MPNVLRLPRGPEGARTASASPILAGVPAWGFAIPPWGGPGQISALGQCFGVSNVFCLPREAEGACDGSSERNFLRFQVQLSELVSEMPQRWLGFYGSMPNALWLKMWAR